MNKLLSFVLVTALTISASIELKAQSVSPFEKGDRVTFVGNSITDGGHYHSYIWLYYMTRYPDMPIEIINAGIGGDTSKDISERLDEGILCRRPNKLTLTFGMNDTDYFMVYNNDDTPKLVKERVKKSLKYYSIIEDRLKQLPETDIILIGGTPYDEFAEIEGNDVLKTKNDAIVQIIDAQKKSAKKNDWEFVDFNDPMVNIIKRETSKDPKFTLCGNDRIHPDNDGHMVMASIFLEGQGFEGNKVADFAINGKTGDVSRSENCKISNVSARDGNIEFDYLANALPYPLDTVPRGWMKHKTQAMGAELMNFNEKMNQELFAVAGLSGNYELVIDDETIATFSASDLAKGVNLAEYTNTPQYQQALSIMFLNEKRWSIERETRDYAWVQFSFFQNFGLLFANDREAIERYDAEIPNNGWLPGKRDGYASAMHPAVREAWAKQQEVLVDLIYKNNKPVSRHFELKVVD